MSYDIEFFPIYPGESIEAVLARRSGERPGPASPMDTEAVITALLEKHPALEFHRASNGQPTVELNDDVLGLQIALADNAAYVTLAYWHDGQAAEVAMRTLWSCAATIRAVTGYAAFNPQTGLDFDPNDPQLCEQAAREYVSIRLTSLRAINRLDVPKPRPGWKFW